VKKNPSRSGSSQKCCSLLHPGIVAMTAPNQKTLVTSRGRETLMDKREVT